MNTATLVKDNLEGFNGHAALYRCDPKHEGHEFVVVSSIDNHWGYETYLFPANDKGEVIDWMEMQGSQKGTQSHTVVWTVAGYVIA
jgi:hypothetical protein